MARPLATAARLAQLSMTTSRTLSRSAPQAKTGLCVLCQRRIRPYSDMRLFHSSRTMGSSETSNPTAPEAAKSSTEDNTSPLPQMPDITDHYTIFPKTLPNGPPPASPFAIMVPDLRREFLALQALMHPDKFAPGPTKQRAEALSARINEAYRALADPLPRAQYLLVRNHDIDVTAEDGAHTHPQDKETLMQVLETQEAIEEAQDEAAIAEMKTENDRRIEECVETLGKAFDEGDAETARTECVRLRFWYNIRDCLKEWEPGKEVRLVH